MWKFCEICIIQKGYYEYCDKCSSKIRYQKVEQTCLEKYGIDNPMKYDSVKEKTILTNLEKYDVKYPIQNLVVKEK